MWETRTFGRDRTSNDENQAHETKRGVDLTVIRGTKGIWWVTSANGVSMECVKQATFRCMVVGGWGREPKARGEQDEIGWDLNVPSRHVGTQKWVGQG